MISIEQTLQWEAQTIEDGKKSYSDEQLWEWFFKEIARQEEVETMLPDYYAKAHGAAISSRQWYSEWKRLALEYGCNDDMIKLIVWHLQKRGDVTAERFLADWRQQKLTRLDNPNVKRLG